MRRRIGINEAENKKMWNKYHNLRDKADYALQKLADFALELGRGHLADGFTDDMDENYIILEEILEEKFGSDPEYDDEYDDDEYEDDEDKYDNEDDDFGEGDEDL